MKVRNYQELIAWQRAMDLVEDVYRASKDFPREEFYALTSQIRRAAVSVPSNIAEGQGRRSTATFFTCQSLTDLCEKLETQILISKRLEYINCVLGLTKS